MNPPNLDRAIDMDPADSDQKRRSLLLPFPARSNLRALPSAVRQRLLQTRAWHWDMLATPRELFDALSEEVGVKINGPPTGLITGPDRQG